MSGVFLLDCLVLIRFPELVALEGYDRDLLRDLLLLEPV